MSYTRAKQGRPITSAAPGLSGTTSYPRRQSSSHNITLKSLGWGDRPTLAIRFFARKSSMISERHSLISHPSPSRKPTRASRMIAFASGSPWLQCLACFRDRSQWPETPSWKNLMPDSTGK